MTTFLYFAYGSNLWLPRIRGRCPSATPLGVETLSGWRPVYDKPSTDGSAKLNIRPDVSGAVHGVVYEIAQDERPALDRSEPRYVPIQLVVGRLDALTYVYRGAPSPARPYDWYVATVVAGAARHGIPWDDLDVPHSPDRRYS